jgi:hypothetical protein
VEELISEAKVYMDASMYLIQKALQEFSKRMEEAQGPAYVSQRHPSLVSFVDYALLAHERAQGLFLPDFEPPPPGA